MSRGPGRSEHPYQPAASLDHLVTVICSPGIEHRDFPILVRRAVRQRLGEVVAKVGQVRIAATTADSIAQGNYLAFGQPDFLASASHVAP